MPIIEVEHLTKEYRLGALQSLKQTMLNAGARLIGRTVPERPLFKALDDVSFTIEQGEVVGIIGHNGAGKSTLLKMLARISTPTSGSVKVNGRIAPLIEVGAGFVPDFTGRENVYLNGAILGMSKREIDRKFDEIVEFSEMAEFIDTPVKRYSSGMQVKLAFAVATSNEAQVLIVDEVLAVGDIAFQRKCFDRLESLIRSTGQTVIVVSHNIRQIERLCSRVLHLSHGQLINDGPPARVCNEYYELMDKRIHEQFSQKTNSQILASGEIELLDAFVSNADEATPTTVVDFRRPIDIHVRLQVTTPVPRADIAFGFHTTDMLYVTTFNTIGSGIPVDIPQGTVQIRCRVRDMRLLPRVYGLRIGICDQRSRPVWYSDNVYSFSVRSADRSRSLLSQYSLVDLDVDWTINGFNIEQNDESTSRAPSLNQPA